MQYIELTGKCKTCLGCNLLELKYFKGKENCNNYTKANESGLDMCKKIIEGVQMKI